MAEQIAAFLMKVGDVLIRSTGNRCILSIEDRHNGGFITYQWYYTANNPNVEVEIHTSRIWDTALVKVERDEPHGERE
jgi:hypothetical protein